MAVDYAGTAGFNLPGIDYTLTKPMDLLGAVSRGLDVSNQVLNQPNINRGRKLQAMQQEKVLSGEMPTTSVNVNPQGLTTSSAQDALSYNLGRALDQANVEKAQVEAQYAGPRAEADIRLKGARADAAEGGGIFGANGENIEMHPITSPTGEVIQMPFIRRKSGLYPLNIPKPGGSSEAKTYNIGGTEYYSIPGQGLVPKGSQGTQTTEGGVIPVEDGVGASQGGLPKGTILSPSMLKAQTEASKLQKQIESHADALDEAMSRVNSLMQNPNLDTSVGGVVAWGKRKIPGTKAKDFSVDVNALKGSLGAEALNSLKGIGRITNLEMETIQKSLGNLDTDQSPEKFRETLSTIQGILQKAQGRLNKGQPQQQGISVAPSAVGGGSVASNQPMRLELAPQAKEESSVPSPTTADEVKALPKGTQFMWLDGTMHVRN